MAACNICCEDLNSKRTKVTCAYCQYECCSACVKKYITDTTNDPHCMSCRNEWSLEFIDDSLNKTFRMTVLKKHRETVLYEREQALLPSTLPFIEQIKRTEALQEQVAELTKLKRDLEHQMYVVNQEIYAIKYNKKPLERKEFTRACPADGCRGFLSTQWKCGLCECNVCPDCQEVLKTPKAEHTCDPNILETVKMIKKECRQCPNTTCGSLIYKIQGCDQMFCTKCNTAFSWRTGRIEDGVIHNPHFYEWQRQRNGGVAPRVQGDVPCGGFPGYNLFLGSIRPKYKGADLTALSDMHRFVMHVNHSVMPTYRAHLPAGQDNIHQNQDLRVSYLLQKISEAEFKRKLQIREKHARKNKAIYQVLDVFMTVCTELFHNVINQKKAMNVQTEVRSVLVQIANYCNDQLHKVSKRFDCVVPVFNSDLTNTSKYRHGSKSTTAGAGAGVGA
jgi:hypothetical protein